jgi:DMSO/TMAO reductase YedYZ molybdopterin-dependent catalytic subunit
VEPFSQVELQLAARNHGMPLEALHYDVTPAGLHYLLIHYDIPPVDSGTFALTIGGMVERELSLSLDDLRARPAVELEVTMECAGNGRALLDPRPLSQPWFTEAVGNARWRGTPLRPLIEEAEPGADAVEVLFTGLDRGFEDGREQTFERSLALDDALREEVLLAYDMNGAPLLPQHGFPLRLVVPGWYGMASVKWLTRITLVDSPFDGYQQSHAYRVRAHEDDEGTPLARMLPRSLMIPPGLPEFPTRARTLTAGVHAIHGRAWSGHAQVAAVEFSADGGETWAGATLGASASPFAWRAWHYEWTATPGDHVLCCRARDQAGNVQPSTPTWNVGGYANNAVQRVPVTVV